MVANRGQVARQHASLFGDREPVPPFTRLGIKINAVNLSSLVAQ